jgi:hypothetical protein
MQRRPRQLSLVSSDCETFEWCDKLVMAQASRRHVGRKEGMSRYQTHATMSLFGRQADVYSVCKRKRLSRRRRPDDHK